MKTLAIRAGSAIFAVLVISILIYFFEINGLKFLCYLAAMLSVRELTRLLFKDESSFNIKMLFAVSALSIFVSIVNLPAHSILLFTCISIVFCCGSLLCHKKFEDLTALSLFQAKSILGFFYVGLLPAMAYRILELPQGLIWFLTMLAVIFMGDTFAYLTGMLWGREKILPAISPKKTIVGSIGGLVGSGLAGGIAGFYFLSNISLIGLITLSIITGIVAQLGDLFESMLKRVADRKDSGSLMPGHGGILDRLDGVLFGAPIMLAGALLLQTLLERL